MPKKILMITPLPPPMTGQALACQILYEHLLNTHNDVENINLSKQSFVSGVDSFSRIKEIFGVLVQVFKKSSSADQIYFTPAESIAGNLKDLLIYILIYRRIRNTVIHLHGGAGMRKILCNKRNPLRYLNAFFISKMQGVIVLGDRLADIYDGLIAADKIHIAPNFSQPDYFISTKDLKQKYKKNGPINIIFLSNLLPGKGYDDLLNGYKKLPPEYRDIVHLDFAGGFENDDAKNNFIAAISDMPNVIYHGVVSGEKKKKLLQEATVFCLPTYYPYEGQPISILEAYASGCVVLTTDHSGIFDIFKPGFNGLEVGIRNEDSIADSIISILGNRDMIRRIAVSNLYSARHKYQIKHHIKTMSDIMDGVDNFSTPVQ